MESPDGRYLYYFRNQGEIWRLALRGSVPDGPESKVETGLPPGDWGNWAPANDEIFYIPLSTTGEAKIQYMKFADGSVQTVCVLRKPPVFGNAGLALSPDGKTLLFAQVDQADSNIFVQ